MANINKRTTKPATTVTSTLEDTKQLNRLVLAHLLWEDTFYTKGVEAAQVISQLVARMNPRDVADIAIKARNEYKLRHVPLLLLRELARYGKLSAKDLVEVIQRPDEMSQFMSIYWKQGKCAVSNQVKKGLAGAFLKFNEYALAKHDYNSAAIKLRDVMFLCHPKPQNPAQEALFKRIANNEMKVPDTWETALSGGADKAATFRRLMSERKLGALAFIRNLRNMLESGITQNELTQYAAVVDTSRVLPFRYVAAYRQVPALKAMLESMLFSSLKSYVKLKGRTVLMVDVSGSMFGTKVSSKSDLDRFDAAAALAILAREICEESVIYTFSDNLVRISSNVRGFDLIEALSSSQRHSGTNTRRALMSLTDERRVDRLMVFTDEQSTDGGTINLDNIKRKYVLNVANEKRAIATAGQWDTVTGFSESVITYIHEIEKEA